MLSELLAIASTLCFLGADAAKSTDGFVTCASVVKLRNNQEGVRLHSHDIKYGSGSGQQSVTAIQDGDDVNSHWQILPPLKGTCRRGEPVKCGSKIRFKHLTTGCFLHSHLFNAPLSKENQEVSCFGKEEESDTGDHWIVVCSTDAWFRKDAVKLKHEDTGKFLATSGQQYGRPISGQYEVMAMATPRNSALWKTAEGIYMDEITFIKKPVISLPTDLPTDDPNDNSIDCNSDYPPEANYLGLFTAIIVCLLSVLLFFYRRTSC